MNRDLRIGLSLSLLALGAAGAFCFRADPAAVDPLVAATDVNADDGEMASSPAPPPGPPPAPVRLGPPPVPVAAAVSTPPPPPVPALGPPPTPAAVVAALPLPPPVEFASAEPPADDSPRTYTVADGDTLSGIAERELGSHRRYHTIFEANRDLLESPDALRVGMTLKIPERAAL